MSTKTEHSQEGSQDEQGSHGGSTGRMYARFAGMILTAVVIMYFVMFAGTYAWSHVTFSESRVFMALTMGGAMVLIMLGWMLNMLRSAKANLAVVTAGVLLLGIGIYLDRSQTTVQDQSWMSSMIPHHSLAITRSERAEISDVRVCRLAADISEAQRREILEMEWYINDIQQNGPARTAAEAEAREVPDFQVAAERSCAGQ